MFENERDNLGLPEAETNSVLAEEDTGPSLEIGVVSNCKKLNVRAEPDVDADVVCIIDEGTEVSIDMIESTDEFYAVYLVSGVEGYCMRKFIAVK